MSTFPGKHLGGGIHEILLDPGKHVIEAYVSGFHIEKIPVEVVEGETVDKEVKLTLFRK